MTSHVFTYGSLMFAPVWTRVVTGAYASLEGTVADLARFAVAGEDYPGMIPAAGARTSGIAYLNVSDADLERLDRFEGAEYRREILPIACADGAVRICGTYVFLPVERLLRAPWLPEAFATERMPHFLAGYCRDWPAR